MADKYKVAAQLPGKDEIEREVESVSRTLYFVLGVSWLGNLLLYM